MSVRRWASQDLVLAAISVAAITLGLWPTEPTRQMIHCRDVHGNTSSYSLELNDSRLARLRREIDRRQSPPPTPTFVLAKWRKDLAGHYTRRCEAILKREGAQTATSTSKAHVVAVSFSNAGANGTLTARELAFWGEISKKSQQVLTTAEDEMARRIANQGPPPVVLGAVFMPPKPSLAWMTACLLGMFSSCVLAEWRMRAPAIEVVRTAAGESTESLSGFANAIRIEIPIQWMKIHQPASVWGRRLTLACLVAAAIATYVVR